MARTYPSGYAGANRTWAELMGMKTVWNLHPEVRRRLLSLMDASANAGVPLGVGTGWRKQPLNPNGTCKQGFACPGNSYHEGFMPGGTRTPDGVNDLNALAIDTVPTSAWPWMNANCHRFGFRHFANIGNEPWHIQPFEISTSRHDATSPPSLLTFDLPDDGIVEELPMTPQDIATVVKIIEDRVPGIVAKVWAELISGPAGGLGAASAEATLFEIRTVARQLLGRTDELRDQSGENFDALLVAIAAIPGGGGTGTITDADLERIATKVADEQHRRLES